FPSTATGAGTIALTAQQRFVRALYQADLGRTGVQAEWDAWLAVLNGPGGQQAVVSDIENSFESSDRLVKNWYQSYLGRQTQKGEELGWVNLLQTTHNQELVQSGILSSTEFFNLAQGMGFGGTPDQNFVQALYRALLGRSGSQAESANWVGALAWLPVFQRQ